METTISVYTWPFILAHATYLLNEAFQVALSAKAQIEKVIDIINDIIILFIINLF